ncbi:MAG TPA: glycosyltransferase, partial [Bacillota bacterium]|nr:glycosyltransferase [Bacillota bacterium]
MARKRQLLKFFLVGAANTCLDFGLFNFLVWLLAPKGTLLFLVNLLSVSLAAGQSFLLHRSWTFTAKGRVSLQLGRFFIATGGGIILNSLLVLFASKWAQFSSIPQLLFLNSGKALAAIASGTWNFLLYKYWVFLPERVSSFPEEGKKGLVSVVIPAFNEEKRLPERLAALIATLPRFFPTELIVVDDGSLDGTRQLAQKWAETAPCVQVIGYDKNQGKGEA